MHVNIQDCVRERNRERERERGERERERGRNRVHIFCRKVKLNTNNYHITTYSRTRYMPEFRNITLPRAPGAELRASGTGLLTWAASSSMGVWWSLVYIGFLYCICCENPSPASLHIDCLVSIYIYTHMYYIYIYIFLITYVSSFYSHL